MKNLSYSDEMLVMLQREGGPFRAVRWGREGRCWSVCEGKSCPPHNKFVHLQYNFRNL